MKGPLQILLVEDNRAEAVLLQESIAQIDDPPEVLHIDNLDEAIECLKSKKFDAVLLDLAHQRCSWHGIFNAQSVNDPDAADLVLARQPACPGTGHRNQPQGL